jgi:NAD(P)-dependent dehydrogenase (short-subunit alcohol dehydrogenase family)
VLLLLAGPAYASGLLLAGLHAGRPRGTTIAAAALAGAAAGIALAGTALIPHYDAPIVFLGTAAILALAAPVEAASHRHATEGPAMDRRCILVTGVGDRGQVAYTVARRFLEDGAAVLITGRTEAVHTLARELAAYGTVAAMAADLTDEAAVRRVIETARERFGRLDAVINAAGGLATIASVEDTGPDAWRREIERNATTAFLVSRAALPLLRASGGGAIVNFTAPAAFRAPARLAAYSAAKAAVAALTRAIAIEEKDHGIRANAIAPGMIDTDQNRRAAGDADTRNWVSRDAIADVVLFLAGAAAAGVTGETVTVAGRGIR